jgi:hypothetical protein
MMKATVNKTSFRKANTQYINMSKICIHFRSATMKKLVNWIVHYKVTDSGILYTMWTEIIRCYFLFILICSWMANIFTIKPIQVSYHSILYSEYRRRKEKHISFHLDKIAFSFSDIKWIVWKSRKNQNCITKSCIYLERW